MKKILAFLVITMLCLMGVAHASWFSANTNEAAFSSNTADATTLVAVVGSETDCVNWSIWEKTGKLDIIIVTDGTPTSAYPKGNTNLAISGKMVWAGTVYASKLNKRKVWARGNSTTATILYSSESQ
jgi:hypothetical protein